MNLIICSTTLQVLIATRIIEEHPEEKFYGIFYSRNYSPKIQHYYERLANSCYDSKLIIQKHDLGRIPAYKELSRRLMVSLSLPKADTIYLSNLDIPDIHFLMRGQRQAKIVTFDDGTFHLGSKMYEPANNLGAIHHLCYKYLDVPTLEDILRRQSKHYSIYKLPNIMGETEYIPLFKTPVKTSEEQAYTEEVSIFLGQPIYELSERSTEKNIKIVERITQDYGISKYYPHPREKYHVSGVEYIDSPLIFEEYILQEIQNHPSRKYKLYAFCSTLMINLHGLTPQLEFISLRPQQSPEFLDGAYDILSKLGIPQIALPYSVEELL